MNVKEDCTCRFPCQALNSRGPPAGCIFRKGDFIPNDRNDFCPVSPDVVMNHLVPGRQPCHWSPIGYIPVAERMKQEVSGCGV